VPSQKDFTETAKSVAHSPTDIVSPLTYLDVAERDCQEATGSVFACQSDSHLHGYLLVWGVALQGEILKHKGVYVLLLRVYVQHLHERGSLPRTAY